VEIEGYCLRCAAPIPRGSHYCPRCGAPTAVHYTSKPPRIRLTPGLGLALLVAGAALYLYAFTLAPPEAGPTVAELAAYLVPGGAALLLASLLWRALKPWAIELLVPAGAALTLVEHVLLFAMGVEAPSLLGVFKAGIAFMAAGVAAWLMARREASLLNTQVELSRSPLALSLATALLLELVMASGGAFSPAAVERSLLALTALGVAVWLTWHFYAPRVFKMYIGSTPGTTVMLDTGVTREELGYEFTTILLRSFTLVLMVFSAIVLALQLASPQTDLSSIPSFISVAKYSLAAEVALGVFGPPAYWLSDALDLRVFDRARLTLEKAAPIDMLDNMVDAFALLGFLLTLRDITLAVTPADANPALYLPVAIFNSVLLFYYYVAVTLPPALIATALYHKYSFRGQLQALLSELKPLGVDALPALIGEASRSSGGERQISS